MEWNVLELVKFQRNNIYHYQMRENMFIRQAEDIITQYILALNETVINCTL